MKITPSPLSRKLAATLVGAGIFFASQSGFADDQKPVDSEHGFYFVDKIDKAFKFDKAKFANDETPEYQDYIKKINNPKIKLCPVRWQIKGPPDGHGWYFTCEGKCGEKRHCEIHVVFRSTADDKAKAKIKITGGKDSNVAGPPHAFSKHVLLIYCECQKD